MRNRNAYPFHAALAAGQSIRAAQNAAAAIPTFSNLARNASRLVGLVVSIAVVASYF